LSIWADYTEGKKLYAKLEFPRATSVETPAQLTEYLINPLLEKRALIQFVERRFALRDLQQALNVRFFPFGVVTRLNRFSAPLLPNTQHPPRQPAISSVACVPKVNFNAAMRNYGYRLVCAPV